MDKAIRIKALLFLIILYGSAALLQLPRRCTDEAAEAVTTVHCRYAGMNAEEMEKRITLPLERALQGMDGVTLQESVTIAGRTAITLQAEGREFPMDVTVDILQRLDQVCPFLPEGTSRPWTAPSRRVAPPFFEAALLPAATEEFGDFCRLVREEIVPLFRELPAVQEVSLDGYRERELLITADPYRLSAAGLLPNTLAAQIRSHLIHRSLGKVMAQESLHPLLLTSGITDPASAARLPIRTASGLTPLKQLARISWEEAPALSRYHVDGNRALGIRIYLKREADCLKAARAIEGIASDLGKKGNKREGFALPFSLLTLQNQGRQTRRSFRFSLGALGAAAAIGLLPGSARLRDRSAFLLPFLTALALISIIQKFLGTGLFASSILLPVLFLPGLRLASTPFWPAGKARLFLLALTAGAPASAALPFLLGLPAGPERHAGAVTAGIMALLLLLFWGRQYRLAPRHSRRQAGPGPWGRKKFLPFADTTSAALLLILSALIFSSNLLPIWKPAGGLRPLFYGSSPLILRLVLDPEHAHTDGKRVLNAVEESVRLSLPGRLHLRLKRGGALAGPGAEAVTVTGLILLPPSGWRRTEQAQELIRALYRIEGIRGASLSHRASHSPGTSRRGTAPLAGARLVEELTGKERPALEKLAARRCAVLESRHAGQDYFIRPAQETRRIRIVLDQQRAAAFQLESGAIRDYLSYRRRGAVIGFLPGPSPRRPVRLKITSLEETRRLPVKLSAAGGKLPPDIFLSRRTESVPLRLLRRRGKAVLEIWSRK